MKPAKNHPWRTNLDFAGRGGSRSQRRPKYKKSATCEVCGLMPGVYDPVLEYDHNHGTGEHRGWLCGGCNSALGFAGDNPLVLRALVEYLETRGYTPTRQLETPRTPPPAQVPTPAPLEPFGYTPSKGCCQGACA